MHFQLPPYEQSKLVTVISGIVLDVVVDLRKNSPTFGKTYSCMLDDKQRAALMVPAGFAHGFATLDDSLFLYKSSNIYNKESECGIRWNDPDLNIEWPIKSPILSDKDLKLPSFQELLGKSVISRG
jgi:dTDP-4-dehydrorhamnose 3,5-epimerase